MSKRIFDKPPSWKCWCIVAGLVLSVQSFAQEDNEAPNPGPTPKPKIVKNPKFKKVQAPAKKSPTSAPTVTPTPVSPPKPSPSPVNANALKSTTAAPVNGVAHKVAASKSPVVKGKPQVKTTWFQWAQDHFEADAFGSLGYSSVSVKQGADAATLLQWGFGGTLAYKLFTAPSLGGMRFYLGGTSDYRLINQYSQLVPAVGNMRGKRWNVFSPTVVARTKAFIAKFDFQFLGNYNLSNPTAEGSTFSYQKPIGARLIVLAPVKNIISWSAFEHLYLGVVGEYLRFSQSEIKNVSVDSLNPALQLWQFGVVVSYGL